MIVPLEISRHILSVVPKLWHEALVLLVFLAEMDGLFELEAPFDN